MAVDRKYRRQLIIKLPSEYLEDIRNAQKDNSSIKKGRAAPSSTTSSDVIFTWGNCSRPFFLRIGLVTHERASRRLGQTGKFSLSKPCHFYYYRSLQSNSQTMMIITAVNVDVSPNIILPLRFNFALCKNIINTILFRSYIYVVLVYLETT